MKKLLISLILIMFMLNLASAFLETTNPIEVVKGVPITIGEKEVPYNNIWEKYQPIEIKDWLGLGGIKFSGAITSHTDNCAFDCEDIIEISLEQESALVDKIKFIDIDRDIENINVQYQFYVKIGIDKQEVNDYQNICSYSKNMSEICEDKLIGTHIEEIPIWKEYNIGDTMPSGDYTLKLEGSKTPSKNIDWIIETQGKEVSDWAVWGAVSATTEGHGITTLRNVGSDGNPMYFTIVPNKNITLTNVSKVAGDLTPNVTITDSVGGVLSEQTYSGNIATLTTQVNLTAGTEYRLLSTKFTGTKYRNNSVVCGFPTNNTYVAWTGANYDCATINNITFNYQTTANITMNSPLNNTGTNNNTIDFNCTATQIGANVTNMSLYIDGVLNTTDYPSGQFNGVNSYINIFNTFNNASLKSSNHTISLGMWVNIKGNGTADGGGSEYIFNSDYNTRTRIVGVSGNFNTTGTRISFVSGEISSAIGEVAINYNTWHFYNLISTTINSSSSNVSSYFDGVLVSSVIRNSFANATNGAIGNGGFSAGYFNGSLSDVRIYNTSLSSSQISTLYNQGRDGAVGSVNSGLVAFYPLHSDTLDASGNGNNGVNTNVSFGSPTKNSLFTKYIPDGTYKWICEACDADNSCAFAPSGNYTLTIDGTAPVITLISPIGNQGYLIGSNNLSLNFTATDTNLNTCWYSYGNVNHTVTCTSGVEVDTPVNLTNSNAKLILYVNDTSNNITSTTIPINYTVFENSQTFNSATTSFFNENFVLNFSYNTAIFNSISGNLIYNSTTNGVSLSTDGNNSILNTTYSVLGVNTPTNITFYWNLILGNINGSVLIINTSSKKQLVTPMSIDDCSVNSLKIMNLTIYDEDTNAFINSSNSSIMNSTINAQIWLSNPSTPQNNITYYVSKNNTNPVYICVPAGNLSSTPFRMDSAVQYYSTGRITSWAYLQNYSLTDITAPYSRILYDLLNTESQEFKITYKDSNFILVPNVIIDIKKYFVGNGYSSSVEHGLTDSYGQTVGHFVLGTNSYSIDVYSQGNLLSSYPKIEPLCNNIATGDCIINLNALSSSSYTNWLSYQNLNYSYTFSEALRQLTLNWQLQDISHGTTTVNLTVTKFDALNNQTICSITSTGTSGLFNCYINTTFGNTTIEANIYKDGNFIGTSYFSLSNGEKTTFGNTGIIMAFIFVVCCALMFTSSPTGTVIGIVMGLVLVSLLGLLALSNQSSSYSVLALSSGIIWVIVTAIAIIWKINGNQSSGGSA